MWRGGILLPQCRNHRLARNSHVLKREMESISAEVPLAVVEEIDEFVRVARPVQGWLPKSEALPGNYDECEQNVQQLATVASALRSVQNYNFAELTRFCDELSWDFDFQLLGKQRIVANATSHASEHVLKCALNGKCIDVIRACLQGIDKKDIDTVFEIISLSNLSRNALDVKRTQVKTRKLKLVVTIEEFTALQHKLKQLEGIVSKLEGRKQLGLSLSEDEAARQSDMQISCVSLDTPESVASACEDESSPFERSCTLSPRRWGASTSVVSLRPAIRAETEQGRRSSHCQIPLRTQTDFGRRSKAGRCSRFQSSSATVRSSVRKETVETSGRLETPTRFKTTLSGSSNHSDTSGMFAREVEAAKSDTVRVKRKPTKRKTNKSRGSQVVQSVPLKGWKSKFSGSMPPGSTKSSGLIVD